MRAKLYEYTAWENEDGVNESVVLIDFNPPSWMDAVGVASERHMRGCSDTWLIKFGKSERTNNPEAWEKWGEDWMQNATKVSIKEVDYKYNDWV